MDTFELLWTASAEWKTRLLVIIVLAQMLLALRLYGVMSKARMAAAKAGKVTADTYRATQNEPEELAVYNRAVTNQFEAPTMFYALVLIALALGTSSWLTVIIALAFVVLRWMHGLEMVGAHNVMRRRKLFIQSMQAMILLMAEVLVSAMIWA
ncbi:MAG: MAPEG family protein [Pseudomonadota bacterium]